MTKKASERRPKRNLVEARRLLHSNGSRKVKRKRRVEVFR